MNVAIAETAALVGLGRREEALAALRVRTSLMRAEGIPHSAWWFGPVAAYLLPGDRADALQVLKRSTTTTAMRSQVRTALRIDPRMTAWRDDPAINALVPEPSEKTEATRQSRRQRRRPAEWETNVGWTAPRAGAPPRGE